MKRLTEKWEYNKKHSYTYKGLNPSMYEDITDKLGRIEDLEKLSKTVDQELIIDFRKCFKDLNDEPFIEIYDDWRE